MGDATCAAPDCTNKPARQGRGYCHRHYLTKLDDGSLPRLRKSYYATVRPACCLADGCDKTPKSKGYCGTHYSRLWQYGDANHVHIRVRSVCAEEGCDKVVNAQGLCATHGWRLRKYGSTAPPERLAPMERFRALVDTSAGPDGCHPWKDRRDPEGYGLFFTDKRTHRATRWLLGQERGRPLARDEWALHHCDNPPCVNLAHIYVGTAAQNAADRERRGRGAVTRKVTRCRNGHAYTADNVYFESGKRQCRTCRTARHERKYERLRQRRQAA